MQCKICKKENEATNTFCTGCGSSLNQEDNKKIFKKINILRIISSLVYLAFIVGGIYLYFDVINDSSSSFAGALILGPMVLICLVVLAIVICLNLTYFTKNIKNNIKASSIIEIVSSSIIALIFLDYIFESLMDSLIVLIALIVLAFAIIKLCLLKKVVNYNLEDKVVKNNRKSIIIFVVVCVCITGFMYFVSLFTSSSSCNKHYDLDVEQINKEVKSYTYLGEEIIEDSPIGFECRSEDKETYISFKDKYNNDIRYTISDHSKGKISINDAMSTIADVQFANNILKNEKISIVYDEEFNDYEFIVTDSMLAQYFEIRFSIIYKEPDNVRLYQFDLNDINYKVGVTLDQKYETSIDKTYMMPYIEMLVHSIYRNVGEEKIDKFELWLNDDPNLKISSYSSNNIIWNEKEY